MDLYSDEYEEYRVLFFENIECIVWKGPVGGMNKNGIPTKKKLSELGLEFAIDDLH